MELSTNAILLLEIFQRKSSCFCRAFNESHPTLKELSERLLLESFQSAFGEQKSSCFLTIFFATIDMVNLKCLQHHKHNYSQNYPFYYERAEGFCRALRKPANPWQAE